MNLLFYLNIIFPLVMGLILLNHHIKEENFKKYAFVTVFITSILTFIVVFNTKGEYYEVIRFSTHLKLAFSIDGLGKIFAILISILWPITTIYAFDYMSGCENKRSFYGFFILTYVVVLGLAYSGNFFTLYVFYEFLSLVTIPLVLNLETDKARYATKNYILYMFFGASFAFVGLVFVLGYGDSLNFIYGGVMNIANIGARASILRVVYVITFIGFGVKAAVFPFHGWLPKASVAPTPVTALLHAVAVVNSGVFAIIRTTYYTFGIEFLKGTYSQYVVMSMAIITIVFGSTMALRSPHNKKRLAYSTISNISYMLFGITLMNPIGLLGALLHMIFHSFIKITLFFDAGAILHYTKREYVYEIDGFAKYMPVVFFSMTVSGLALMGVPPLAGFYSKFYIAKGALLNASPLAYCGIAALIISVVLTTLYILEMITRGYIKRDIEYPKNYFNGVVPCNNYMRVPLIILSTCIILLSLNVGSIISLISELIGI